MNSSTLFKTENDSLYLYDTNQQQLLNLHPIVETIHTLACNTNIKDITKFLKEKYPELAEIDIKLYIEKYNF